MSYIINKTDGTIVSTVADGQIDAFSTDLKLIGRNVSGFGESLNENFIRLLENFADVRRPTNAIRGQLWFDVGQGVLKVFNGNDFVPVGSTQIAGQQPENLGVGDLWYNTSDQQLLFWNGTTNVTVAPAYSASQGRSGTETVTLQDTTGRQRTVVFLYAAGVILGIFSTSAFTPAQSIPGFSGSLVPGFNPGTVENFKFNVTCLDAEQLAGRPASDYLRNNIENVVNAKITIESDDGLIFGDAAAAALLVDDDAVTLKNFSSNGDMILGVRRNGSDEVPVRIDSLSRTVEIYNGILSSELDVGGDLVVHGNLTVNGTSTVINTATLLIEDKTIVLGNIDNGSPTDSSADEGGVILKGSTDKIILWSDQGGTYDLGGSSFNLYSQAWNISDSINLAQGKYLAIDGTPLIEQINPGSEPKTFRLTEAVVSIDGITQLGKLSKLDIGPGAPQDPALLTIEDNRILTSQSQDLIVSPDGDIQLENSPRIIGLSDPINSQDASTKEYVDSVVETKPIVLSLDISDAISDQYIIDNILNQICPTTEFRNGTLARILCSSLSNSAVNVSGVALDTTTAEFVTPTGTASAVTSVEVGTGETAPAPTISVSRSIKIFEIISEVWTHISTQSI